MIVPTCEEILRLVPKYNIIPICHEVYADVITPIILPHRATRQSKRFFLLESIEGGEKWGHYSFLGYDPAMRATCRNRSVIIESSLREVPSRTLASDQPLQVVRGILSRFRSPSLEGQPPFTGGFVGYFAYVMVRYAEPVLHISRGGANGFGLMLFDKVVAYDHLKQKIEIIVSMRTDRAADPDPRPRETQYLEYLTKEYGGVCREIEAIASLINQSSPLEKMTSPDKPVSTCNMSRGTFYRTMEEIKEYILGEDIFQAVISRQFTSPYKDSLLEVYRVLRTTNPSSYMVYMNIDNNEITNTSSETLVRLKDGRLTTFPMADSRPRGTTPKEDRQPERRLLEDEKELLEHNMLVNLGRNDIRKVVAFDSVEVTEYEMIHRYSKIVYVRSQVEDNIRSGPDGCFAIEALLPAGTLLGAPKIQTCQIIGELEQVPRGIYGGALGYPDSTGNLNTCIAIRMAVKQGGRITVQAGDGVVMDSVPESEHEESTDKARAVINAIVNAGEASDR